MENEKDLASLHIESLLWEVVRRCNSSIDGDGCSIFLREEGTTRYKLRDTTVMNPFLGNYYFTVVPDEKPQEKMGATKYAVVTKDTWPIPDLRNFKYWSNYGLDEEELKRKWIGECELPHDQIGSFLPVLLEDREEVIGVIRVVRHRGKPPFNIDNKNKIEDLVKEYLPQILGAIDISNLLEIGYMLDLKAVCSRIVQVLTKMLKSRGCSIYLFSEEVNGVKRYRCMGTTGLHEMLEEDQFTEIRDPYNEAYYDYKETEIPKHLTTAVIKYRRNIIADDINDPQKFDPKEIFQEIDRSRAKYWETCIKNLKLIPAGPSIFVPLFSPRSEENGKQNVIGVILINRPKGAEPFSPQDYRLFLSISEKLSKIILYSRFMSRLNQPLTIDDPTRLQDSFNSLIEQICNVSGSPGATLFLKSNNKLYSRSSFGLLKGQKINYELPSSEFDYGSGPFIGYTTWVATFKKVLKFNSPQELTETNWNKPFPRPVHSNKVQCEVTPSKPYRFLAVPIKGTNDKLLGVLRTAKTSADGPFPASDETLFSSLATRLSPVIENLSTLESQKGIKKLKLEEIFTKELKKKLEEILKNDFETIDFSAKLIKEFFNISPLDELDIGARILNSIRSMWKNSGILTNGEIPSLSQFKFFDERVLSELPGYRDHFIHQYQVFLLGYYIIEMLSRLGHPFHNIYCESLCLDIPQEERKRIANTAWLVTSTFHDVAYPLEEIKRWLPKTMADFLGDEGEKIIPEIPIEKIFFYGQRYLNIVNELSAFFNQKNFISEIKESDFRAWFQSEVVLNKDHAVLSSLILMASYFLEKDEVILPSALAIALHKRLGLKVKSQGGKISYERYPLFLLLLYCDLVQEWNRDPSNGKRVSPVLNKIIVTMNPEEIGKWKIPESILENKETIYVHSEIIVANRAQDKINECVDWFKFIKQTNPYFTLKINDEFVGL